MLEQLIENLSEDELQELIPNGVLEKLLQYKEIFSVVDDDRMILSRIVLSNYSNLFFEEKYLKNLLIERMQKDQLAQIFGVREDEIKEVHYEQAMSWAENHTESFASKLGFSYTHDQNESDLNNLINVIPKYGVYPYQKRISEKAKKYIHNAETRFLIHLPTGAGKTRTAMDIICSHLREKNDNLVLWLANREELCIQASSEFKSSWSSLGDREISMYSFFSETDTSLSGIDSGIIIGGIQKFSSIKNSKKKGNNINYQLLTEKVTMVVFDEAHQAIAPTYKALVTDFCNDLGHGTVLIGLTATPGRTFNGSNSSQEDKELSDFFGNKKISMNLLGYSSPISYLEDQGYLAKANFIPLEYNSADIIKYKLSISENSEETLQVLSNDIERNIVLISKIVEEIKQESRIIVFASSVEHGQFLASILNALGIPSASLDSDFDNKDTRRNKIRDYKNGSIKVLCNFNILTAGFDAPRTNVAFIARPVNSLVQYIQMAGRAMRGSQSGGNKECKIYTVMDDIPEFRNIYKAFSYWDDMWSEHE